MADLIGTAEAAHILGTSSRTVKRMALEKELKPAHKMPGSTGAYLFKRSDVERLAARRAA